MDSFELLSSATVAGIIPVKKYRSKETGLVVCLAQVEGPLVNGYFCLATEAHDDDGLPHTLEHLVFMGSEEYPYKGMLDLFANRCLARGTNAWTDTDHTCYTMTTAGSEGFLNLLPIYLDHVLYPTLTPAGYMTEVHHVNGEGEDAGVVYCEMQARENTDRSRSMLQFLRQMYPGTCGYKSETGGIMKNLRTTCSHEKVCEYHRAFYRPENLCLIVTGQVNPEDVFNVIAPFEKKIKSKGELPTYIQPWQSAVPPLSEGGLPEGDQLQIEFPTEDESVGMVLIGWRGPQVTELYQITAIKLLFDYLTDTPVAPLQQVLVEVEDSYCGDVYSMFFENQETCFSLYLHSVDKENLETITGVSIAVLDKFISGEEKFDMDRFQALIHRSLLEQMDAVEDNAHDTLAMLSIGDFLYSEQQDNLQFYVDKIERLKKLKQESDQFWVDLMKKYIEGQQKVVIVAVPSEKYMKTSGEEEKNRVKEQAAAFGEEGLKLKKETLEKAIAENEIEPAPEIVASLPIPSTDSICFHKITTYSNRCQDQIDTCRFSMEAFPLRSMCTT